MNKLIMQRLVYIKLQKLKYLVFVQPQNIMRSKTYVKCAKIENFELWNRLISSKKELSLEANEAIDRKNVLMR